ncbi:transposase [Streptomyces sp. NPDC047860]|uniref:transposase n=1 Tax=Streptomyces sp. NPDC047860 TaxID=3155743 RepID=UPI0033E3B8CA
MTLIVDSQSVKGASTVGRNSRGYDAAKKINGRKRHITVDTLGLPVMITVTPADIQDRDAARDVLWRLRLTQPQITQIWADRGYAGDLVTWARDRLWLTLRIVSRPKGTKGLRRPAPPLESRAHDRLVHERPPQRTRLRTPPTALRSTPELGTHHHDDPAPHPQKPPHRLDEKAHGKRGAVLLTRPISVRAGRRPV